MLSAKDPANGYAEHMQKVLLSLFLVILGYEEKDLSGFILSVADTLLQALAPMIIEEKCLTKKAIVQLLCKPDLAQRASTAVEFLLENCTAAGAFQREPLLYINGLALLQNLNNMDRLDFLDYRKPQSWGLFKEWKIHDASFSVADIEKVLLWDKEYPLLKLSLLRLSSFGGLTCLVSKVDFSQTQVLAAIALSSSWNGADPAEHDEILDLMESYLSGIEMLCVGEKELVKILEDIERNANLFTFMDFCFSDSQFQLTLKLLTIIGSRKENLPAPYVKKFIEKVLGRINKSSQIERKSIQLSELYGAVKAIDLKYGESVRDSFQTMLETKNITEELLDFNLRNDVPIERDLLLLLELKIKEFTLHPKAGGLWTWVNKKFNWAVGNGKQEKMAKFMVRLLETDLNEEKVNTDVELALYFLTSPLIERIKQIEQYLEPEDKMKIVKLKSAYHKVVKTVKEGTVTTMDLLELAKVDKERLISLADYSSDKITNDLTKNAKIVENFKTTTSLINTFLHSFDGKTSINTEKVASQFPSTDRIDHMRVLEIKDFKLPSRDHLESMQSFLENSKSRLFIFCCEDEFKDLSKLDDGPDDQEDAENVIDTLIDCVNEPASKSFHTLVDNLKSQEITISAFEELYSYCDDFETDLSEELQIVEALEPSFTTRLELIEKMQHIRRLRTLTEAADTVNNVRDVLGIQKKYSEIESILLSPSSKDSGILASIDMSELEVGTFLSSLTKEEIKALETMTKCKKFLEWIKEMKEMREFKVKEMPLQLEGSGIKLIFM